MATYSTVVVGGGATSGAGNNNLTSNQYAIATLSIGTNLSVNTATFTGPAAGTSIVYIPPNASFSWGAGGFSYVILGS